MKKQKIYISGKISGLEKEVVTANFAEAERVLNVLGYDTINPMNSGLNEEYPWIMHMVVDIFNMLRCDGVYFLENYKESRGAKIEYRIARLFRMRILYQRWNYMKQFNLSTVKNL